jgi:hypothetical protein
MRLETSDAPRDVGSLRSRPVFRTHPFFLFVRHCDYSSGICAQSGTISTKLTANVNRTYCGGAIRAYNG